MGECFPLRLWRVLVSKFSPLDVKSLAHQIGADLRRFPAGRLSNRNLDRLHGLENGHVELASHERGPNCVAECGMECVPWEASRDLETLKLGLAREPSGSASKNPRSVITSLSRV